ncbi:hypothetical protein [Pedobacter psychroterrae]|uniref:Uncharacterized protein n=1 Tax=Pedobacter psychroterrae TaxID=2530453 RepID=A0A4R0NKX1_9SPHI|nr:hypothetical protein [Pedobacter psychroterrae]TCC99953.1 hypothetical protein EZ437_17085 [Pedobacter psychroterrae]
MGIFSFLTSIKPQASTSFDDHPTNATSNINSKTIEEDIFIERDKPSATENIDKEVIEMAITNNLEQLYSFLDKNMESKGYDDALTNPDSYHLEQNLDSLRKELMRTIKRVKTFYEDFIREIDYHIESRSRSGMIDTVEELKMKKEIAGSHIEKVLLIETDALNKEGDSEGIIISYTRGFRNGLAAISHHTIINKKF